ncbi:MAG: ABC transporter permease [Clostridia bacterium]|nr:ABC transporter permease [Clostridia bacterium]
MWKYVLKRLLLIIPILLGVVFIVFAIMSLTPSDPGRLILGISASQESVDQLNDQLGYNRPFMTRFLDYVKEAFLKFEFGNSYNSGKPVVREIMNNFPTTLKMVVISTVLYSIIGITLGVFSAVKQYSAGDNILRVASMAVAAFPQFWLAMMGILVFSLYLGWLPSNGIDNWKSWILPIGLYSLSASAPLLRLTRTIVLEQIRQDYVRTVRAKGAPEKRVIWKHVFKNSALPIINTVGVQFGASLGGMVVMESVYSLPGVGNLALTAMRQKDMPLIMGCTIFMAAIFCLMVLVVDIVSAYSDPRVKAKYAG